MPVTEEHLRLLEKQNALVGQLKDILATQQRALEALGANDDDYDAPEEDLDGGDSDCDAELTGLSEAASRSNNRADRVRTVEVSDAGNEDWEATEEEERGFMSVKPWLGQMAKPSNWSWDESKARDAAPPIKLELEHVHGYRARGVRNNVAYVDPDTVVYPAAAVCVVHSISTSRQKFFRGHDDDVLCLDFNRAKGIAASGQQGKKPQICVWSVDSCEEIACFHGHQRAVVAVSISPDGSRVVSVGLDNDHSIMVHDIETKACLIDTKGDTNRILAVYWNTTAAADPRHEFVSLGSKHIKFWTISGGNVKAKKGLLGRAGKRQTFLDATFVPDHTVIACESGDLYAFSGNKLKNVVPAHNAACFAVISDASSGRIITGGRDGFVKQFDRSTFKAISDFNLNTVDDCLGLNSVRALNFLGNKILVGAVTSSLYEVTIDSSNVKCIHANHCGDLSRKDSYGELWGLSPHPSLPKYATVAEDRTLRVWDIASKKTDLRTVLSYKALCCAWAPSGKTIAVGFENGSVGIFNASDLSEVCRSRKTRERIQQVKYSPCGKYLVTGAADNAARLYTVDGDDHSYHAKCTGASSNILSVDFSADSKYLQTCSQAYELLFFETETGERYNKARDLKDTNWATFSSKLGWNVQGIWPKESDGSDINIVNVSQKGNLLASAEDSGLVKIFQYPCVGSGLDKKGSLRRRPAFVSGLAHSEHVTNVAFSCDDAYVISTGGGDNCVMHWKVVSQ